MIVADLLQDRPNLSQDAWYDAYWRQMGASKRVSDFVYNRINLYSGLNVGQMVPSDRLVEDLRLNEVCWNDWDFDFIEEFRREIGVDIAEGLTENIRTLGQLVIYCSEKIGKTTR